MGLEVYPKIATVPSMPSGFASLPPGSGLEKWLNVRDIGQGTVANAETELTLANGFELIDGLIEISHVPIIGVFTQVDLQALTEVTIIPKFMDRPGGGFVGYGASGALAAGVITLSKLVYRVTVTNTPYFFQIQNPGANYIKFATASMGVVTNSNMYLAVGLGWNSGAQLAGI